METRKDLWRKHRTWLKGSQPTNLGQLCIFICVRAKANDRLHVLCLRENFKAWLPEMRDAVELLNPFHPLQSRPGLSHQVRWAKPNMVSLGSLDKV